MSVDIMVIRGDGDRQGEDIQDRLICHLDVALARGRNECDENSGLQRVVISSRLRTDIGNGLVAEVQDSLQGATWRGKVTSVRHAVSGHTITSDFTIARPT